MKTGRWLPAIRRAVAVAVLVSLAGCEAAGSRRGFGTECVTVRGPGPDDPRAGSLFKQIRFSARDGFDQVVFEFEGLPWGASYVTYPSEDEALGDAGCSARNAWPAPISW